MALPIYYIHLVTQPLLSTDCFIIFWLGTKDAIDLVQGHYIVAVSRDMAPVARKGGLEAVAVSDHQPIYYYHYYN